MHQSVDDEISLRRGQLSVGAGLDGTPPQGGGSAGGLGLHKASSHPGSPVSASTSRNKESRFLERKEESQGKTQRKTKDFEVPKGKTRKTRRTTNLKR